MVQVLDEVSTTLEDPDSQDGTHDDRHLDL
jgi:hypothetical protein